MRLQELIDSLPPESIRAPAKDMDPEIQSLDYDSRRVKDGSLFFAIKGEQTDGHLYIDEAISNGAVAVVSSQPAPPDSDVAWVQVEATRPSMGILAAEFHQHPSRRLQLVGITGTNGKTTTAYLTH